MFFLIRAAFWLMILVLLLPTDKDQQSQVYGTAEAAVKDVVSFCDRNPETCATGRDAFAVVVQKAQFGARMLMDFANQRSGADGTETTASGGAVMPLDPAIWDASGSQDTLNPEDREAAWAGPDAGT
jgi:hypothetical protein